MPAQPLSLTNISLFDARSEVIAAIGRLNINEAGEWLSPNNPYLTGGVNEVAQDCRSGNFIYDDVAAYVAAAAFAHCADSWAYIGRSIDSLLKGDLNAAVHLAYYAELRAAKSLLGSQGIFVGNRYSGALRASRNITKVNGDGTHQAAWKLLEEWFNQSSSIQRIVDVITPAGQNLSSWISPIPAGVDAVIQDMLSNIGFDLRSFSSDRDRRNLASYETSLLSVPQLPLQVIRDTIARIWRLIEPHSGGDFPGIDKSILANILQRQYSSQPSGNGGSWVEWVDSLTPSGFQDTAFHEVLRNGSSSDEFQYILGKAFQDTSTTDDPIDFIQSMLERSVVLARLSTGLCLQSLKDSGKSNSELRNWLKVFAVSRGHIETEVFPDDPIDLMADIEDYKVELEQSSSTNLNKLFEELSEGVLLLGQIERTVVWSFA